jgi:hypothetical protein
MNILKKITLLVLIAGLFVTCNDIIDIEQPGLLGPNQAYQSVSDLEGGLLGVYIQLDTSHDVYFNSAWTDEISIGLENGGQGRSSTYVYQLLTTDAGPTAIWTTNYDAINAATRLIEAAQEFTPSADQQDEYDSVVGQAHAIRAFAHFKLMQYFAEDLTDDSSLGVIIVDEIPGIQDQRERNTTGEVFTAINDDLSIAESLIPVDQSNPNFWSLDAVTALRAVIATYREDYPLAESLSQQIVDSYDLTTQEEYLDLFRIDASNGVLFSLNRTIGDAYDGQGNTGSAFAGGWIGANYAFGGPGIDGGVYYETGRTLYNIVDQDDVRFDMVASDDRLIDPGYPDNTTASAFGENDVIPVNKYRGNVPGENQPLMNNLKVLRVAEQYLINAEAKVANGDIPGAMTIIDEIRDARFGSDQPAPTAANTTEAFGVILDERRVELAFEGHRYLDLGRLGSRGDRNIEKDPLDCELYGGCTPPDLNSYKWRFPIPQVELDANNAISQNPGYEG